MSSPPPCPARGEATAREAVARARRPGKAAKPSPVSVGNVFWIFGRFLLLNMLIHSVMSIDLGDDLILIWGFQFRFEAQ